MKPYEILKKNLITANPVRLVALGYLSHMLLGSVLLSLPIAQKTPVHFLDNLFVSVSAVSTTGLSTVSISDSYNFFGQLIILSLIQLGGIGYMTLGSFLILISRKKLDELQRGISSVVLSMPKNFKLEKFIISVIIFTLATELAGAALLLGVFTYSGTPEPLWNAVFHSISAFCTAGFSLFNNSFESFQGNHWLNFIITFLSFAGAIGFIVYVDLWRLITHKEKNITFTSKIILDTTFTLFALGAFLLFLTNIFNTGKDTSLLISIFQSMSAITTVGFNTFTISALSLPSIVVLTILMIIGASPSGTGGGLKTTTFSAILATIASTIKNRKNITWYNVIIPIGRIQTAYASFGFYFFMLAMGLLFLTMTESFSITELGFEAASALGTVGLSLGITSNLTTLGKLIIITLMYIGRVGVLTFGTALFLKPQLLFDDKKDDLVL
ncbi:MAG: hypothetical protein A2096_16850 [Spirochaetes bacterium GWF1_41_5]|nr:MAG: hypothetical protein A2096_16850 [Spirochaetes bacterium GWF1_41_5]HBE02432.1 potassium transporter KtrB [Spirochaetia bacterium]